MNRAAVSGRREGKRSKDPEEQKKEGREEKGKNEQTVEKKEGMKVTVCQCECV